ncbi:bacterial Ig-like domain-containing protein [Lactiplantibacillus plajomi]|uniref:Bacterial Ig-like domain-containing protein n=1 Tax=Lactiplantibacillus plajomi TaxID=1457217 RepID=A0ABV6K602_9LACO|nr:bacterial Ig-like domain-containing protein [Lactiplantibacillus plajomi]
MIPRQLHGATFTRANTLQANNTGLNNHQFAILAPFIQGVFEANTPVWSVVVSVAGNNITDFSPLKNISPQKRGGMLTAWFQYGWNVDPIPIKAGETMIVTSPLTDIYGDSINYNVRYYQDDGTENGKLVVADAFQEEATTDDGATRMVWKYKLVNPKITNGMVRYGQWGTGDVARPEYTTDSQGNPMKSFQLNTGMHVIQYVTESQASLTFNPSEVVMGPDASWNYVDHINTATDYDGNPIDASQWPNLNIQQVSPLDLASAGQQTVRFAYTDEQNNVFYVDAVVDVVASQATITAAADQIVWPSEVSGLTAADLVASVTDATGQALTDFSAVTMTAVDPAKAGAQPVTLSYTDVAGNVVTATAYVTVDLASLTTTATEVVAGPNASWDYLTAITAATDSNGQTIDGHNADVQVVTPPDLSTAKVGVPQTVVLAYTDNLGRTQTVNATVTTLKSQAILAGTDLTLIAGPNATWQLADSVDLAHSLDASGQPLTTADLTKITADTRPDVQTPGDYPLTLRYVDAAGNLIIGNASVTVVASKAAIKVTDSRLTTGATWQPADNFVSATAAAGQPLALTDLTVTGKVTTNRPGTYQVTYQYTDAIGNVVTATATVTVVDPETPIEPENPEKPKEPEQLGEVDGIQDGDNQQNGTGTGQETTADGDQVDGQSSTTSQSEKSEVLTPDAPKTVQPASAKAQASATSLPQTDETSRSALTVLAGVLGLSSLVAGVGATRRRRDR